MVTERAAALISRRAEISETLLCKNGKVVTMALVVDISERFRAGVQFEMNGELESACRTYKECIRLLLQGDDWDSDESLDTSSLNTEVDQTFQSPKIPDVIGYEENFRTLVSNLHFDSTTKGPATANKGLLVYGPAGAGKSFLVRAAAGTLGLRVFDVDLHEYEAAGLQLNKKAEEIRKQAEVCESAIVCVTNVEKVPQFNDFLSVLVRSPIKPQQQFTVVVTTDSPLFVDATTSAMLPLKVCVPLPTLNTRHLMLIKYADELGISLDAFETVYLSKHTNGYTAKDLAALANAVKDLGKTAKVQGHSKPNSKHVLKAALQSVKPTTSKDTMTGIKSFHKAHSVQRTSFLNRW